MDVKIIGAGLAGVEAAWYLANKGINVKLYEMRPKKMTPAHKTSFFSELVCSNSLRSDSIENAVGLLKREMEELNSIVMKYARKNAVKAGSALAVDRENFSSDITNEIKSHPNIEIINEEVKLIDEAPTIIATGPLTSEELSEEIKKKLGEDYYYFYDAAAPIIEADSINYDIAYLKSRYDKGEAAYLNCPMTKEEFDLFYNELINAVCVTPHDFDNRVFEGCMPIELMAKRGRETLLFGPLKPVGLENNGKKPYAVCQLRQDDAKASMYNLVGFQTSLKFSEQKRVIRLIPGLENANILRYGVMHRNSFINSPVVLNCCYQTKKHPNLFFAGQITGVEGYIESAASGILAAINIYQHVLNKEAIIFSEETMIGAMAHYVSNASKRNFQPMNANYALLNELPFKHDKKERKILYAKRSLEKIKEIKEVV